MKFLLEVLGMTNYCNLRCSYCDWNFQPNYPRPLNQSDISAIQRHLKKLRQLVDNYFPEIILVEYAGGETFLYPEIVAQLLETFPDKWIRLITNGLLVKEEHLNQLKKHGKAFIALSLDGATNTANYSRFKGNKKLLEKNFALIKSIVKKEIPLMLLCTLHDKNINEFAEYISFLENNFSESIANGMLVMPAHSVSEYGKQKGRPPQYSCENLVNFIDEEGDRHPIIHKIKDHYSQLAYFMNNHHRDRVCKIHEWLLSVHFRGNEIVTGGNFLGFGCGMRGEKELGIFDINSEDSVRDFVQKVNDKTLTELFNNPEMASYQCSQGCFVDWIIFDLVLSNAVSLEQVTEWFIFFRDPQVQSFVKKYTQLKSSALV